MNILVKLTLNILIGCLVYWK